MKKIVLLLTFLINIYSIGFAQCVPSVALFSDKTNICQGQPVVFTAVSTNQGTAPLYEWFVNDISQGAPSATIFFVPTLSSGSVHSVYTKLTSNAACLAAAPETVQSNTIVITVSPTVEASVAISADQTTICSNGQVTFTATPTNGGTPSYKWIKNGTPIFPAETGSTYTATSVVNGASYTVEMTSTTNCASPTIASSNPVVITVIPTVQPAVSITADPTTICANGQVTFTATPINGGTAPIYEWSINAVNQGAPSGSTTFTTTALTSSSDVVGVILTSNVLCASPTTAVAQMSIQASPGIGAGTIGADQTICYNTIPAAITQISAPTNILGLPTYIWEVSLDGTAYSPIVGETGTTYTFSSPLTQDLFIRRITTDPGTPAPCNTATSNVIHITVRPQLIAGTIEADETICSETAASTIIQTTDPTGGTGIYTYQWETSVQAGGPYVYIAGATSSIYNPGILTTTRYFRRIETSGICGSVFSNEVAKIVTPQTVVTVSINDPGQTCSGTAMVFTATQTGGGTTPSYTWYLGTSPVGTNSNIFNYTAAMANTGQQVNVRLTSSDACNTGVATSNIVTLDIVNPTTPTVTISTNNNPNCAGLISTFTATSTGGGPMPSYQWKVNNIPVAAGSQSYSSSNLVNGDEVKVELTSSLACLIGTNPFVSNVITMDIRPIPTPIINEGDQTVCAPNTFTYTANGGVGSTYQWVLNAQPIIGATTNTYIVSHAGSYSIQEDNGACNSTSDFAILTVDPCGAFSSNITGPNPITPGQQSALYSVPNQTNFTYLWSIEGGTIISGQNTNEVTVDWDPITTSPIARTTSTAYSISVLETNATNQTKTTSLDINTVSTGTTISQAQAGISIFPNPTSASFNITMPESGVDVRYEILNVTGARVANGSFTSTGSTQKIETNFGAGMYQVVLTYNNIVTSARLSKVE